MVLQCPKCPLRFDSKPMMADHLSTDHGVAPEVVDPLKPPSARIGLIDPDIDGSGPATRRAPAAADHDRSARG